MYFQHKFKSILVSLGFKHLTRLLKSFLVKWSDFQILSLCSSHFCIWVCWSGGIICSIVSMRRASWLHSSPCPSRRAGVVSSVLELALLDCAWLCLLECTSNSLSWLIWSLPSDVRFLPLASLLLNYKVLCHHLHFCMISVSCVRTAVTSMT